MQLPPDIIEKLLLSIVVGGAIGAEREYRSKSAGFRTLTLICLGSALFTIFSMLIGMGIQSGPHCFQYCHGYRIRRGRRHFQR